MTCKINEPLRLNTHARKTDPDTPAPHKQETLMFWLAVEVFRNRNWKAAKFFGIEDASFMPGASSSTTTSKKDIEIKSSKNVLNKADAHAAEALKLQRKLDQSAALRIGVTLEQLYVVKEADFIFDTFINRDGTYWTCIDASTVAALERQLRDPASLNREVFHQCQLQAFAGMNDDLMPRFIKEMETLSKGNLANVDPNMRGACTRYLELKKAPLRRKTGVSTALAFSFRSRKPSKTEETTALSPTSVANGTHFDPNKATSLLRQRSEIRMLGSDGGSVGALALSRSRLSHDRRDDMAGTNNRSSLRNSMNKKQSSLSIAAVFNKTILDNTNKRISAPVKLVIGGEDDNGLEKTDSFTRRVDIGMQRSRSDIGLLTRGTHQRAKEFGLGDGGMSFPTRSTVSVKPPTRDTVTFLAGVGAARKRENSF